jgi:hypothetical protein
MHLSVPTIVTDMYFGISERIRVITMYYVSNPDGVSSIYKSINYYLLRSAKQLESNAF